MRVTDLEGSALDYWVARVINNDPAIADVMAQVAHYSTNWAAAGPIIERERIGILAIDGTDCWIAGKSPEAIDWSRRDARSPLVAAMRCFVKSKYGEEVPDGND